MVKQFIFSMLLLTLTVACGSQNHELEKNTSLTADKDGVSSSEVISVAPPSDPQTSMTDPDELLPSNSNQLLDDQTQRQSDETDGGLQDRSRKSGGHHKNGGRRNSGGGASVDKMTVGTAISAAGQSNQNSALSFIPASITKLITAGIALETLGADFRFTHLFSYRWIDKDAGAVSGFQWSDEGDPSLGNRFFSAFGKKEMPTLGGMAKQLKDAGIRSIKGKITLVSADPRFDSLVSAAGVEASDRASFFGAMPTAFCYQHNFPRRSSDANKSHVHDQFVKELRAAGIAVDESGEASGGTPGSTKLYSQELRDLIVPMNKASDNLIADTLFFTIARYHSTPNQNLGEVGRLFYISTLRRWMKSEGTPDLASELVFFDGSGLSRNDQVTPRSYLAVLKYYVKQSYFADLLHSLPIGGVDGTLGSRMKNAARGKVFAKTGTVRDYYQLAGYVPSGSNNGMAKTFVPFVILTRTPDGGAYRQAAHNYQDQVVARLVSDIN